MGIGSAIANLFQPAAKAGKSVVDNVAGKTVKGVGKAGQPAAIMPRTTRSAPVGGTPTKSPATVNPASAPTPPTGPNYKVSPSPWAVKSAKNTAILAGGTGLGIASLGGLGAWGVQKVRDVTVDADQAAADRDVRRLQDINEVNENYYNLWKAAQADGASYALPSSTFPNQGVIFPGQSASQEYAGTGGSNLMPILAIGAAGAGAYFLLRKKGKRK